MTNSPPLLDANLSEDHLLNRRIVIRQPLSGYRVAIDPVFLAASLHVKPNETVLDVGAGVGAASLCLAHRLPCRIIGIEVQREYMRLGIQNIDLNQMKDRVDLLYGDLLRAPPRLAAGTFDHVMTNPPYLEEHRAHNSPDIGKSRAHAESSADFEAWARFCLLMVKPKGTVTFIHRADRLDQILAFFLGKLGGIKVYPLWPGQGKPAKRVLIQGIKNSNASLTLCQGMILHESDGRFTCSAEEILRHGKGIDW